MESLITGIHHVTAIASDAQHNIDFYTSFLGLRLVKKTINFDGPDVYHFYYGDDNGSPGSLLTFFPYSGLVNGRHGKGMLNTTTFSVPYTSMNYWLARFKKFDIAYKMAQERLESESVVYFEDEDGLGLELVFNEKDKRPGISGGPVQHEHAIRGLYNVEIWLDAYERTAGILTEQLGHRLLIEKGGRLRFGVNHTPGSYIDIICSPDTFKGLAGSGTVHHLALATPNRETQEEVRKRIEKLKLEPTAIRDRNYFTSVYFREPGGVLFEVATEGPGFFIDEAPEDLGTALKLPPQFEKDRQKIENALPPVTLNTHLHQ